MPRDAAFAAPARHRPDPLRGLVAGLAAGLVASLAMELAQQALSSLQSAPSGGGEPATEQAADKVSKAVTGHEVAKADKEASGRAVHYGFGALLGAGYGLTAEYFPALAGGTGSLMGLGTALVFDEAGVPLAGLGAKPWEAPASTHAYSAASHLVYGVTAEVTRRLVRAAL